MRKWGTERRRRFPDALLSLNPRGASTPRPSKESFAGPQQLARKPGPPRSFLLRSDFVTPEVVKALEPHDPISIWNDPGMKGVTAPAARAQVFREAGGTRERGAPQRAAASSGPRTDFA